MKLFLKIFLWFLAAISLLVGVVIVLNWTVQTEPVVSRWRISVKNQTNIYARTVAQIFDGQGEQGATAFLGRLRAAETIGEVDLIAESGQAWLTEGVDASSYSELVARALATDGVEIVENLGDTALSATRLTRAAGERYVLIIRWERPRMAAFFGEPPLRYVRYGLVLMTALLLCAALARYLSSPIGKIRAATHELADGNLNARVAERVGRRRDELADLARDFDIMAGRIEKLIKSQQRLSRDVSHELRSPLGRMNVALEIAKQRSTPESAPLLERIEKESARLNDMISRILILAKLESGSDEVERERVDLSMLVSEVVDDADFEAQVKQKAVIIKRADKCEVLGSANLLRSALENVLRNAVRYTAEGTSVDVELTTSNGRAAISVTDHGGGVPEDELENLFRPFYRVAEARERKTGGIGLGLAIAQRAIRAHDGTINARNIADGLSIEMTLACGVSDGN